MDLTKAISYNGLTVANSLTRTAGGIPVSGYLFDEINGSQEDVDGYLEKRANQDGLDASDIYLGARRVTAILSVYGSTKGDYWDKAQDVLAAFSPTIAYNADTANLGFLAFDFYQPTADISTWPTSAYPSGIPMRFYLRPSAPPAWASRRDEQGGVSGKGLSKQMRLSLVARDPRKYVQTASVITIASGTASASSSATYLGDYPTTGTATITSASTTGNVVYTIAGSAFTVTLDAASTAYTLDLAAKTFSKAGTIAMNLLVANASWPTLGTSTVTVVRSAGSVASSISLSYRDAFA